MILSSVCPVNRGASDRVKVVAFVVCPAEKFVSEYFNVVRQNFRDEEMIDKIWVSPAFC